MVVLPGIRSMERFTLPFCKNFLPVPLIYKWLVHKVFVLLSIIYVVRVYIPNTKITLLNQY